MSNKRSRRKKVQHFFCPFCETRLWRLGSTKHHIFYRDAAEIRKNLKVSAKKAAFLATQKQTYLDNNSWLEEFFCPEHGKMWLRLLRQDDGKIGYQLAKGEDWQNTNKTIDPSRPNPSVSEFTYRMSRKAYHEDKAF